MFDVAASAISYPFRYSDDEWTDLGALHGRNTRIRPGGCASGPRASCAATRPTRWRCSRTSAPACGLDPLSGPRRRGHADAGRTLDRGWGSCRDFAVLLADAARSLGFGARIVSGYLFNPNGYASGSTGGGSTHAWAEIYVPGAGWITFDPTNRSVGGFNLIPVAVARDIAQVVPVAGSFVGTADAFGGMTVEVDVGLLKGDAPS